MPRYQLTRPKPTGSRGASNVIQTRVVEIPEGRPVPNGATAVASDTELSAWADQGEE